MLKKFTAIFLSLLLITVSAPAKESHGIYTLSLNDAMELAFKNNPQLLACDIKKKSNQTQLGAAKIHRSNVKNDVINVSQNYDLNYVQDGYYVEVYESAIRLSDKEKEQITASIAYRVTEKYYNFKLGERLVEIAENAYRLSLENKDAAQIKFELGLIPQLEVTNAQVASEEKKYELEAAERNMELLKENLKIELQLYGEDCEFILTDDLERMDYTGDVNEDAKAALETRYDALSIYEAYLLAKMYFESTGLPANTAIYQRAYSSFVQSEYTYQTSLQTIPLKIKSSHNEIISAKNNLEIAEKNLEIKRQEYDADKLRFELKIITNTALNASLNNLAQSEVNLERAELVYKLAVEKYKYQISIGGEL